MPGGVSTGWRSAEQSAGPRHLGGQMRPMGQLAAVGRRRFSGIADDRQHRSPVPEAGMLCLRGSGSCDPAWSDISARPLKRLLGNLKLVPCLRKHPLRKRKHFGCHLQLLLAGDNQAGQELYALDSMFGRRLLL